MLVSNCTTSTTNLEKPNAPATAIFPVSTRGFYALAINDSRQVTGYSAVQVDGYSRYRGFVWQNGSITSLGILGGDLESAALDINDKGQIVGYSGSVTLTNNPTRAVLWNNGRLTNLGGTNSKAYAINNRGQIVGSYTRNGAKRAFKWENRTMINLGTLRGYNNSEAYDINNKGQVVGYSYRSDSSGLGPYHAFKWDNGILTDLGTLGGDYSIAYSINNAGKVVGSSRTGSGSYHAFVWNQGRMRNLNNLLPANSGWELNSAQDINNNGQIVGYGKFNGQSRSFLLTPITVSN